MADSQRKSYNLFDKDNADIRQCYVWNDRNYVAASQNTRSVILACKPNTTYTVSKTLSDRFALAYTNTDPTLSDDTPAYGIVVNNDATSLTITTGGSAQYLVIFFIYIPAETKTVEEIVATIMVNEGQTAKPYEPFGWLHSLRKLGTATDTITTLPVDIYADGNNATVGLKGNTVQSGTPTPSNPVEVNGVGVRTENLFDGQLQQGFYAYVTGDYTLANSYVCTHLIPCTENTTYTFRCINTGGGSKNYGYVFFDSAQNRIDSDYINVLTEGDVVTHTATTPQNTAFLAINVAYGRRQASVIRPSDITDFMLNTGSTAKPYEPYGYKIPISNGQQTTNIYLGSTQTTRQIKKLVLTGTENWSEQACSIGYRFYMPVTSAMQSDTTVGVRSMCTHQKLTLRGNTYNALGAYTITDTSGLFMTLDGNTRLASWKSWLAAQYAAGTPVTVWYVLVTETTGIVNEPIRKIGNYADTVSGITIPTITGADSFDVQTTLKPSEVSLAYTGWHDATVKEWDGSQWNE